MFFWSDCKVVNGTVNGAMFVSIFHFFISNERIYTIIYIGMIQLLRMELGILLRFTNSLGVEHQPSYKGMQVDVSSRKMVCS